MQVYREHGRSAGDAIRALGEAPLAESRALRIGLRFAPGPTRTGVWTCEPTDSEKHCESPVEALKYLRVAGSRSESSSAAG